MAALLGVSHKKTRHAGGLLLILLGRLVLCCVLNGLLLGDNT